MSEKLLKFLLKELETVRIKCLGTQQPQNTPCPMIYEIPVGQLGQTFPHNQCPVCRQSYENPGSGQQNILETLGKSIGIIKSMTDKKVFDIEFVLPDRS